jgi:hypothetical protein
LRHAGGLDNPWSRRQAREHVQITMLVAMLESSLLDRRLLRFSLMQAACVMKQKAGFDQNQICNDDGFSSCMGALDANTRKAGFRGGLSGEQAQDH